MNIGQVHHRELTPGIRRASTSPLTPGIKALYTRCQNVRGELGTSEHTCGRLDLSLFWCIGFILGRFYTTHGGACYDLPELGHQLKQSSEVADR